MVSAVIVAAGSSRRMGFDKLFATLRGKPLIAHSIAAFEQTAEIEEITKLVAEAIAEAGATSKAQMGAVMKIVQAKAAGRADGKALSQEVQKQLP